MDTIITSCLPFLQSLPAELLSFAMLVVCVLFLLLNFHFFGKAGVISFIVMMITIANIQVLKPVYYQLLQEPLALGTVCFTTTLLASDILNEHYGPKIARMSVLIGFVSQLFFTIILSLIYSQCDASNIYSITKIANLKLNCIYLKPISQYLVIPLAIKVNSQAFIMA
jgi:uncharacterized PurR-regulated membrane protein YhhQ (DUF165 family)